MKLIKMLVLMIALMLAIMPLAACSMGSVNSPKPPAATPAPTAGVDHGIGMEPMAFKPADTLKPAVYKSLSGFSLDLFQRMAAEDLGKNVFISPLSVWLALGMTYNGASGTTAEGMAKALHASGIALDDLNKDNAGLMGVLTAADPKVKIAIANSIWIRQNVASTFNKDFLDRDQKYYTAQIQALDFANSTAADTINKWVEDNTNGNIKGLVQPPIDPSTVMFLINAVHFKAPWKQAFDPKDTVDGTFTKSDGSEVQIKFLSRRKGNLGFVDDNIVAARIPYAAGRLEMVAVMPLKQTLADFVKNLTNEKLDSIISQCGETSLNLRFPKFKLEYKAELNDALKAMGMDEAFSAAADFTAMSKSLGRQLVISKVSHKAFIEVNEEGTEASAATSVEMELTAMPMSLEFNKPFVYLIRDSKTGAVLFMGTMENPA